MSIFLDNVSLIILQVISWISQFSTNLLSNPIFIILISVFILILLLNLLINLINNIKWKKEYSSNAKKMEKEEYYDFLDRNM